MYLTLKEYGFSKSGKTKEFEILSGEQIIGCIRWFSNWRKYCFYPNINTIWDSGCLGEVRIFLDEVNKQHKEKP
jgi:hypothetical protein